MFAFSSVCLKILFLTNCTYCSCVAGGAVGVVQCARKTGVYAWAFGKRFFVVGVRKAPKARQMFKSTPFGVIGAALGANRTISTFPVQVDGT